MSMMSGVVMRKSTQPQLTRRDVAGRLEHWKTVADGPHSYGAA